MKETPFLKRVSAVGITVAFLMPGYIHAMPAETTSPYASVPLNLQGAQFIPPNVMLFLDTSRSMYTNTVSGTTDTRTAVAARVTKNLFANNKNVRWGLFSFDNRRQTNGAYLTPAAISGFRWNTAWSSAIGAYYTFNMAGILRLPIDDYSSTHLNKLNDAVDEVWDDVDVRDWGTNTPLSEAYVEMVHYFAGLSSVYDKPVDGSGRYVSPVQYRCQKNYIIDVTDGDPTQDEQFPALDPILGNLYNVGNDIRNDLATLTKRAYEGDLMQGLSGQPVNDKDNVSFDDPDYQKQFISTYTVGFAIDKDVLLDAANNGGGQYFTANNESQLNEAFQKAIQDIVAKTSSVPAPVSISQPSTGAIQVGFNTEDWSGTVKTFAVDTNGNISSTATDATVPAAGSRMIFTSYGASGSRAFTEITATNSTLLADTATFGTNPDWTLKFITGQDPTNTTTWRKRNGKLFGDFINTESVSLNGGNDFVAGANDGLLHYFRRNNKNHPFSELFAYAPSATLSKIQYVAKRDYGQTGNPHRYLVDGGIATQDLNMGSGGDKTVLAGTLGRGGKGIYALNLSKATANSPNGIHTDVGIFDWNNEDLMVFGGGINMGYTFGKPVIAKVKQPGGNLWMVITGNGYDSSNDWPGNTKSGLLFFLMDPDSSGPNKGQRKAAVPISASGMGSKAGIGGIAVMDSDNDGVADFVYAGDRNGDLWRVDLKEELHNWTSDPNKTMAYRIWKGDPSQPITMTPTLYRINQNEVMVLFGTGSMLLDTDKTDKTQQSVYGIRDNISTVPTEYSYANDRGASGRLLQQTIEDDKTSGSESYRKVSKNQKPADGSKPGGWYMDLEIGDASAERVTQQMMVLSNGVFFTTQIPATLSGDRCTGSSGDGWIMALSAVTGSAPLKPVFSPAEINFSNGPSTVAGFKNSSMGMPSGLGLLSSSSSIKHSSYTNLNGMITNMEYNYMESSIAATTKLMYACEDKVCTTPLLEDTSVTQGYRITWREL